MKKIFKRALLLLGLCGLSGLSFMMGSDWGGGAMWATSIYAVLISIFLGLQIYGFVVTQVRYSDSVEQAKFQLLEAEDILDFSGEDSRASS